MPVAVASARQKLAHTFIELAIEGLARMFVPDRQLFCSVLRRQPDGRLVRNGISRRYTMMTLLGLHRLETVGMASPIATEPVLNELLRDLSWISTSGDLGNLLWTCAELDPERLPSVYRRINLFDALPRFQDYARASTTELAWLLTGLSLAQEAASPGDWQFEDLTVEVNQKLHANQGPHGIFGHLAPDRSVAGRVRGCIGSFADQVYPIFALSQFSRVVGDSASILHASQCAAAIVNAQGPNGEWWWHYHSGTGLVTRAYPVYSVHQDGMAPMALQALSAVYREQDFTQAIERGLEWIPGNNILQQDMRSAQDRVIWRSIALKGWSSDFKEFCCMITHQPVTGESEHPYVVYECRPYELGWALYALAGL